MDVYLLGAGFSRAASDQMPLMADLADELTRSFGYDVDQLSAFDGDLEAWLSFLATDQPWLTEPENLRKYAAFIEASTDIRTIVQGKVDLSISRPAPAWLMRFVYSLAQTSSSVITFNYDTILERIAVELRQASDFNDVYATPLPVRNLPGEGGGFGKLKLTGPTFRLHKLHGSINWFSRGLSRSVVTSDVYLVPSRGIWAPDRGTGAAPVYGDLAPFIIPPVASKDAFYANDVLRAQWRSSASVLTDAKSLTIIGYSFPVTDSQSRVLFRSNLAEDAKVHVVERDLGAAQRISSLFENGVREVTMTTGEGAVEEFVSRTTPHLVEWFTEFQPSRSEHVLRLFLDGSEVAVDGAMNRSLNDPEMAPATRSLVQDYLSARWSGVETVGATTRYQVNPGENQTSFGFTSI